MENMLETLCRLEGPVLLWIQEAVRQPWLDPVVEAYTRLGNAGLLWIVLSAVMLCHPKTRKAGALALLAMVLGLLCTNVALKHLVGRTRPWIDVAGLIPLVSEPDPNSFPSGHTCAAFAAGMIWARALPAGWMRVTAVVLAVCMGLSRLYVGVHYPSDVLVGAVVGALCAWAAWSIGKEMVKAWKRRWENKKEVR